MSYKSRIDRGSAGPVKNHLLVTAISSRIRNLEAEYEPKARPTRRTKRTNPRTMTRRPSDPFTGDGNAQAPEAPEAPSPSARPLEDPRRTRQGRKLLKTSTTHTIFSADIDDPTLIASDHMPSPEQKIVNSARLVGPASGQNKIPQPGGVTQVPAGKARAAQAPAGKTATMGIIRTLAYDLIYQTRIRDLQAVYNSLETVVYFTLNEKMVSPDFYLEQTQGHHLELIGILKQLLEQAPVEPNKLPEQDAIWFAAVARAMLHETVPAVLPTFLLPHLRPRRLKIDGENYEGTVFGIDPKSGSWQMKFSIVIGSLGLDRDIVVPSEIQWQVWEKAKQGRSIYTKIKRIDQKDADQALRLAKLLVTKFMGFIGPMTMCKDAMRRFRMDYETKKVIARYGNTDLQFGPLAGYPAWYPPRRRPLSNGLSILVPGTKLEQAAGEGGLNDLVLPTLDRSHRVPVMTAIIVAFEKGD